MGVLQPKQFFHGTRAEIPVGGRILPSSKTGVLPSHDISDDDVVYMAKGDVRAEKEAWGWAEVAWHDNGTDYPSRPWVARVQPSKDVQVGPFGGKERVAKSAKVKERIDVMPGRQATFPNLNWNQFASMKAEFNHPSDADILGGHDAFARKYRPGLFETPRPEDDLNHVSRRFEYDPADPDPGQRKLF